MIAVLRLFSVENPRWRVERIAEVLGVSHSTAYRCVADLARAGFVEPVSGGLYVLGPACIELDRRMRLSDPLLRAAVPRLRQLGAALGPAATVLLARHYRDGVMFVHIERGDEAPAAHDRGQQLSLFSPAATARAVLFALPERVLRSLYRRHAAEIAAAGLGASARELLAQARAGREAGWVAARSVVVPRRVGVAAAVVSAGSVCGCIAASVPEPLGADEVARIGAQLEREARVIARRLAAEGPDLPRLIARQPKRAVRPAPTLQ